MFGQQGNFQVTDKATEKMVVPAGPVVWSERRWQGNKRTQGV